MLTFACASAAFALFRGQNSTSSSSSNRCRFTRRREATKNSGAKHPASSNQPQKSSKFAKPCSWNFCAFCAFSRQKDACPFVILRQKIFVLLLLAGGSQAPRPKRAESLRPSTCAGLKGRGQNSTSSSSSSSNRCRFTRSVSGRLKCTTPGRFKMHHLEE
jgi:hypothetical protein